MPRPVKDDPRDRFKTFRFTQAEITRLQSRARAERMTLSDYVRARVLTTPQPDAPMGPRDSQPAASTRTTGTFGSQRFQSGPGPERPQGRANMATRALAEQLRRVGVNLNQIAHRMNELRIPPPRELTMVLDEIRTYVRQVREP